MSFLKRCFNIAAAAALLWAGFNVCPMDKARCEEPARTPCGCPEDDGAHRKCCSGIHLCDEDRPVSLSAALPSSATPALLPALSPSVHALPSRVVPLASPAAPAAAAPPGSSALCRAPPAVL
ncbi:MAG: hypothetical protein WC969_05075 [Elusimicrobiota bacterium]|jgi:hypothetical protein